MSCSSGTDFSYNHYIFHVLDFKDFILISVTFFSNKVSFGVKVFLTMGSPEGRLCARQGPLASVQRLNDWLSVVQHVWSVKEVG